MLKGSQTIPNPNAQYSPIAQPAECTPFTLIPTFELLKIFTYSFLKYLFIRYSFETLFFEKLSLKIPPIIYFENFVLML